MRLKEIELYAPYMLTVLGSYSQRDWEDFLGGCTPSYILHTRAFWDVFIEGVIYLGRMIIRGWYFTCKEPENIICDDILHVNMFHYFNTPYIMCKSFAKFTYNEYIYLFFIARCF